MCLCCPFVLFTFVAFIQDLKCICPQCTHSICTVWKLNIHKRLSTICVVFVVFVAFVVFVYCRVRLSLLLFKHIFSQITALLLAVSYNIYPMNNSTPLTLYYICK